MNFKNLFFLFSLTFVSNQVFSQCQTDHYHKEAIKNSPQIIEQQNLFYNNVDFNNSQKRATKYIIPIVFHVIHTNGSENISMAQIQNQIDILNEDFSLNNANKVNIRSVFKNIAADCQIEFKLAKLDPNGNCTDGVNRVYSPLHVDARDNIKGITGARWDNRKYLNVWTVSSIANQSGAVGTTLGYAYLPQTLQQGLSNLDGIVMRSDYVGTIGTGNVGGAGRTLTHEVGHYLGLFHPFDDGCAGTGSNRGDKCADTPPVSSTFTNATCPVVNNNSCTTDNPDIIDQWENYMDYSRGECQSMFSANQKSIMHGVIEFYTFRKSLVSANNLIATGLSPNNSSKPVAAFAATFQQVCVGEKVKFTDLSCKATVVSRLWKFSGANITSTNTESPEVTYSTPGKYKVSLAVTNAIGTDEKIVDEYIIVFPRVAIDKPTIRQEFESINWNQGTGWMILDQAGSNSLRLETSIGFNSKTSLVAPITNATPTGQRFQLVLPPVDLRKTANQNPKLSMMVGYRRFNASSSESIRLYYSIGCNNNWTQFLFRNSNFLASSSAFTTGFKPSVSSDWKLLTASVGQFQNDSNISFMIEIESGSGNSVYLDNINVGLWNSSLSDIEKQINLMVYPNPSTSEINVSYENLVGTTEVWLETIEGKKVAQLLDKSTTIGEIKLKWNAENLLKTGVYILKVKTNEQLLNKKVIFAN